MGSVRLKNERSRERLCDSRQAYHAVPCMGCVVHPLNIRLGPKDLAYIIGDAACA